MTRSAKTLIASRSLHIYNVETKRDVAVPNAMGGTFSATATAEQVRPSSARARDFSRRLASAPASPIFTRTSTRTGAGHSNTRAAAAPTAMITISMDRDAGVLAVGQARCVSEWPRIPVKDMACAAWRIARI